MISIDWKLATQASFSSLARWLPKLALLFGLQYIPYPFHYASESMPGANALCLVHGGSAVLLIGLGLWGWRRKLPPSACYVWLSGIAVIAMLNTNAALAVNGHYQFALGNLFAAVAAGLLAPTLVWFFGFQLVNLAACVATLWFGGIELPWFLAMIGFGSATVLAGVLFYGRMDYLQRMEATRREVERNRDRDFREIIEKNPDAVVLLRDGIIVYASAPLAEYLGLDSSAAVVGQSFVSLVVDGGEDLDALLRGEPRGPTCIVKLERQDGERLSVDVAEPKEITFDGAPAVMLVARDVTASQEQLNARLLVTDRLSAAGTLAAGVAHEINNPLTYVALNVRELQDILGPHSDPDVAELLGEVADGVTRMTAIVKDLGGIARVKYGLEAPSDPVQSLQTAIKMTHNQLRHRSRVDCDLQPLGDVTCNEGKLVQVFVNLLINAAHALDEDASADKVVRVSTRQVAGEAVITVADTGCGMSEDTVKRMFDPFFTTKEPGKGTGLGMYFCHSVIDSVGGRINVNSKQGVGTTVEVFLPTANADALGAGFGDDRPSRAETNHRGLEILVVDDEPLVGRALSRLLSKHNVTTTHTGQAALEAFARDKHDLVVCDIMMPGMTGKDVYESLLAIDERAAERVVFLTGGAFTPRMQEFASKVQDRLLHKPVQPERLLEIVDAAARRRRRIPTEA